MRVSIPLCAVFTLVLVSMLGPAVKSNAFDPLFWPARIDYWAGTGPRSVSGTDLDSDGDTDVAVANFDSDNVSILLNTTNPPGIEEVSSHKLHVTGYQLYQNYPNPFSSSTSIKLKVKSEKSKVSLRVYDLSGRLVKTLLDGSQTVTGYESPVAVRWDGRDSSGRQVANGVYFYRLKAGQFQSVKKMVVLK